MNGPPVGQPAFFVPQTHYQGTVAQDIVLMNNGGTLYVAPELTSVEKAIVLYHYPDTVFPDRDPDLFPQPDPCPIAEAILINNIHDALSKPRTYQEYPLYATDKQEVEIGKWLEAYEKDPGFIYSTNGESLMKPYERNAAPLGENKTAFKVAKNIISTYASGLHRHSHHLRNVIGKTGDDWLVQKMGKFLLWHMGGGQEAPCIEADDEMAANRATGDIADRELDVFDHEDQMDFAHQVFKVGLDTAKENVHQGEIGIDLISNGDSSDTSSESSFEEPTPVAEGETVRSSSEESASGSESSSSETVSATDEVEAGPSSAEHKRAERFGYCLTVNSETKSCRFIKLVIQEDSTLEQLEMVLKRTTNKCKEASSDEDLGVDYIPIRLTKKRSETLVDETFYSDMASAHHHNKRRHSDSCTTNDSNRLCQPASPKPDNDVHRDECLTPAFNRDDDEVSVTMYPFPDFDNEFYSKENEMIVRNIMQTLISNRIDGYEVTQSDFPSPTYELFAPSSPSTSVTSASSTSGEEEIINFQPLNKKPSFKYEPSSLASKLPGFLDAMKRANDNLDIESATGFELSDSENEDDGVPRIKKAHIEMNLGLGVLEEQENDEGVPYINLEQENDKEDDVPHIKEEYIDADGNKRRRI